MSVLFEFLQGNRIDSASSLPLMHTTRAHHLRSILKSGEIVASECDVFQGENLNYFFVGRPAYKFSLGKDAKLWELPVCFILDYDVATIAKRVFPFDTGGFSKNKMPEHLTSHDLESFEVSKDPTAVNKIIGTFFGTAHNYFQLKPSRSSDALSKNDVSVLDSEIHSLHALSVEKNADFEDRYLSIEVQSEKNIELKNNKLLAAVVPSPYMDDEQFLDLVENEWKCDLLSYPIFPLNPETYFYGIYAEVEDYLSNKGYFK